MENRIQRAVDILRATNKLLVLSGAGISTSAGIPDFRGEKGIYTLGTVNQDIFDLGSFKKDPSRFWNFGKQFMFTMKEAAATPMHRFIASLEKIMNVTVVTQNIDDLHKKAGSSKVIELHGSFKTSTCLSCGKTHSLENIKLWEEEKRVPECDCGGVLKPDIVFFGEPVKGIEEAFKLSGEADTMMVVGSTLTVYPASLLPAYFKGEMIVVNKGSVSGITVADLFLDLEADKAAQALDKGLFGVN